MSKNVVTKEIAAAIIDVFPAAANMEIAPHPLGNGYCVHDADGNVAGFEYDPVSHVARMTFCNIPHSIDVPVAPPEAGASQQRSVPMLYPRIVDRSWKDCPAGEHGALPGILSMLAVLSLIGGVFVLFPLIYPGIALIVVSIFLFWFSAVIKSLRNIEAHLFSANHPDWDKTP